MQNNIFTASKVEKNFYVDAIPAKNRGKSFSIYGMLNPKAASAYITDKKIHDANFAVYTTTLAKLHELPYEPIYNTTYAQDVNIETGGGFVDYISYYTIDWAGIMDEFRNVMGNNANYIPRVNAGLNQEKANVYTWEVAFDLRFVELEKAEKLTLTKSIQDIYQNIITAGFDLFCQKVAYTGVGGATGLFNSTNVYSGTIDNSTASAAHAGFKGMPDDAVVSFFNGIFEYYLSNSNMNLSILPDTFLVPNFVGTDLTSRMSALYTATLRNFILTHNLAIDESDGDFKLKIRSRSDLNDLGVAGLGRIVAYKNDKKFVRMDVPYPLQQYITLPNIERMSYTTAFVGQVSEVQMPYNTNSAELGIMSYWDFTY